ncbi:MAG: glutamine amidotransferase [Nocardioides sp.]
MQRLSHRYAGRSGAAAGTVGHTFRVRPFLFLQTRPEESAAAEEYAAFCRFTGLAPEQLVRHRLDHTALGEVALSDWTGFIVGGGPFNVSDPAQEKSQVQDRVESELRDLALACVESDHPFLGACYGVGTLGSLFGGLVSRAYGETAGAISVSLTRDGRQDPLFDGVSENFEAFVGHKEAVEVLPSGAVLLARGTQCPVQAFRIGTRVYATQFHPELDIDGLASRMNVYRHHGYFDEAETEELIIQARRSSVTETGKLLANFVSLAQRRR